MAGPKILLVDDEEELTSTMAERLSLRGFRVETTTSGADALRRVGETRFDIVLLDVKMPGMDGLELMTAIRREHADLPAILFTGYSSVADAERGMREGAFDYVMKPFDIDDLIEKIGCAIDKQEGRDDE